MSVFQARRYLQHLPSERVPIAGSEGALIRKQTLARQFPVHDIEPQECHELSQGEIQRYVNCSNFYSFLNVCTRDRITDVWVM